MDSFDDYLLVRTIESPVYCYSVDAPDNTAIVLVLEYSVNKYLQSLYFCDGFLS